MTLPQGPKEVLPKWVFYSNCGEKYWPDIVSMMHYNQHLNFKRPLLITYHVDLLMHTLTLDSCVILGRCIAPAPGWRQSPYHFFTRVCIRYGNMWCDVIVFISIMDWVFGNGQWISSDHYLKNNLCLSMDETAKVYDVPWYFVFMVEVDFSLGGASQMTKLFFVSIQGRIALSPELLG